MTNMQCRKFIWVSFFKLKCIMFEVNKNIFKCVCVFMHGMLNFYLMYVFHFAFIAAVVVCSAVVPFSSTLYCQLRYSLKVHLCIHKAELQTPNKQT